jgi:hypothetical protein
MNKSTASAPTAADVRALFRSNPERFNRLTEAAQATVAEGARGRLHPGAVKEFNKGRKAHRRYVLGATTAATEARKAQRAALAQAGVAVGKRGPLSAEALASLKG